MHRGSAFLFHGAISRLDIPRDDVSTTCVYLMRRFHHGLLRRRGKVSSWLISKVAYFCFSSSWILSGYLDLEDLVIKSPLDCSELLELLPSMAASGNLPSLEARGKIS